MNKKLFHPMMDDSIVELVFASITFRFEVLHTDTLTACRYKFVIAATHSNFIFAPINWMKLQIQCQNFANQRSIASGIHHPASCKNSLPATTISKVGSHSCFEIGDRFLEAIVPSYEIPRRILKGENSVSVSPMLHCVI